MNMNNYPFTFSTFPTLKATHFGKTAEKVKCVGDWKQNSTLAIMKNGNEYLELKVDHSENSFYYKSKNINRLEHEGMAKEPLPADIYALRVMMARDMQMRIKPGENRNHALYHLKASMPYLKTAVVRAVAKELLVDIQLYLKKNYASKIDCQWKEIGCNGKVANLVLHVESEIFEKYLLPNIHDELKDRLDTFNQVLHEKLGREMNEYRKGKMNEESPFQLYINEDFQCSELKSDLQDIEKKEDRQTLFEITMNGLSVGVHYWGVGHNKTFDFYAKEFGKKMVILEADAYYYYNEGLFFLPSAFDEVQKIFFETFKLEMKTYSVYKHLKNRYSRMFNEKLFYENVENVFRDVYSFLPLWSEDYDGTSLVVIWDDAKLEADEKLRGEVFDEMMEILIESHT